MSKIEKIGIIGGGKMGSVLVGGLLTHGICTAEEILVSEPDHARAKDLHHEFGVHTATDNVAVAKASPIILIAVKPQHMAEVLVEISSAVDSSKLVISIAAGIPLAFIAERLKKGVRIIRAMPNTPALVQEGMTALAPGESVLLEDMAMARSIFDAVGQTVIVPEEHMDAVTGLSGSGPAYGFVILEALSDAGVLMGLTRDTSLKLAAQTLLGAARLVLSTGKHPGELKDMVTSPGGTTIAGLRALENGRLRATLIAAVEAATLRSRDLGKPGN